MGKIDNEKVFNALKELCNPDFLKNCRNERYMHHYFSRLIQEDYKIEDDQFHPEWATAIKNCRDGGLYNGTDSEYVTDENGTAGHIDFAIGDYDHPEIGIEFKFCDSWNMKPIVSDYMKLMDEKNNIKKAISLSIIYREEELSSSLTDEKVEDTITELKSRLEKNSRLSKDRDFEFWIVECAPKAQNEKIRVWYCDNLETNFKITTI